MIPKGNRVAARQPGQVNESLDRAMAFLIKQQSADGSWKSEYYGNLKQGAATTSLSLFALSHCDNDRIRKHILEVRKGFEFLKRGIKKHGYVANESGPDYACYATALAILANGKLKSKTDEEFLDSKTIRQLQEFLFKAQLHEKQGFKPEDLDYGGWDLSGWSQEKRETSGSNVSVSSFVLKAIATSRSTRKKNVLERATPWLARLHNPDGGFHFHPEKSHPGNKAGWNDVHRMNARSYGTATCDALRIVKNLPDTKVNRKSIVDWIEKKTFESFVPGFKELEKDPENLGNWSKGLYFYYCMSLALELDSFSPKFQQHYSAITLDFLKKNQHSDGSWSNRFTRMREDDPLIATPLGLIALCRIVELSGKQ